ncbi:uncharacterized protein LOC135170153 [Diachasmimorpha longicaudata]|uniref:uncharacterized protein LOC135170153 n=1 Tax=Diachasmimorpha longicaudata TaxID=58733 RepID=UPI0030B8EAE0
MAKFVLLFLSVAPISSVLCQIPSYLKICGRRDPDLGGCIKTSIESLRDNLRVGMPEIHVPSVEPLNIEEDLTIANSDTFKAQTHNTKVYGVSEFNLTRVSADLDNTTLEIDASFDKLKLEGDYDILAQILVPIRAEGPIEIDAVDITAKLVMKFKYIRHKGKEHIFFTSTTCKLTIRDYESQFISRPGEDQTFSEAINNVLNSNKQEIIAAIIAGLERGVAKEIIGVTNLITTTYTFDELLPDRE